MCDCYYQKCVSCSNEISLHIADFCTPRENIVVMCPECLGSGREKDYPSLQEYESEELVVERPNQVMDFSHGDEIDIGIPLDTVKLWCKDRMAYGIHLN